MSNPVNETILSYQPDAAGADSNNPVSSSPAGTGDSQELAGNLRLLKSIIRETVAAMSWERWKGIKNLAAAANIAFTYGSATTFTVNDNFSATGRNIATLGRRVKCTLNASTIYGYISVASWSSPNTTITVVNDTGSLDNTLSEVAFGPENKASIGVATGTSGYFLRYNGTLWVPDALVFADVPAIATTAQWRANTAEKILTTDQVWAGAAFVALTDAATIAVDMSLGFNFSVTLGGNRTLGNPTNPKVGQQGVFIVTQDGTGSRTLTLASNYKKSAQADFTLSTTAAAKDLIGYFVQDSSTIILTGMVRSIA